MIKPIIVTLLSLVIGYCFLLNGVKRVDLPPHLLGHHAEFIENLLSPEDAEALLSLAKEMGDFPTNQQDTKFYTTLHEHVGEARPITEDGTCPHPFLVPNRNKTLCVLPGRIDVGRHYILGGGVQGLKEPYEHIVSRLFSFGRYIFDPSEFPRVQQLFQSEQFIRSTKAVCPADKQLLDPFQFNFIVQVPGQTVALHIDAVYFHGATRFEYPQWLLAVMQYSGLFQDLFIDQLQGVAYFHRWNDERGGNFVYWQKNEREPVRQKPLSRAGSFVDGSKVVHAATVYRPDRSPPIMEKSFDNRLVYIGDDHWQVQSNGTPVADYTTDDLRWTIVYRGRCFKDQKELDQFRENIDTKKNVIPLEQIMETLKQGLVDRGKHTKQYLDGLDRLDLSILLMDEYIHYPLSPDRAIPWNYCALPRLPFLQKTPVLSNLLTTLLKPIC